MVKLAKIYQGCKRYITTLKVKSWGRLVTTIYRYSGR